MRKNFITQNTILSKKTKTLKKRSPKNDFQSRLQALIMVMSILSFSENSEAKVIYPGDIFLI